MNAIINADFNGFNVSFRNDAYINATAIAKQFGKRPVDYLKIDSTQRYITALAQKISEVKKITSNINQLVIVKKGGTEQGTWLHPKLAIDFARWLSPEFAVWCDEQIERILGINLSGDKTTADDRTGLRHAVDAMVTKKGLLYPDVYRLVHQRFNVEHIDELTLEQVGEATEYLHRLMLDIEKPLRVTFDKRAVESIVAVCHHVAFLRSWWDYYGEAIRKLNSNVAFCIHDHFTHANLHAGIIHSRTDLDFKLAQNMKDYPWEADYFTRQEFWRALPAK